MPDELPFHVDYDRRQTRSVDVDHGCAVMECLTPDQARRLAKKLVEVADIVEKRIRAQLAEPRPGWHGANDHAYLRYQRDDGSAEVRMLISGAREPAKRPWMAILGGYALRGRATNPTTSSRQIRRFGTALSAILALEEVELKREGSNG